MWQKQKTLARLREELRTLEVFDRVHGFAIDPDPADTRAYASRQIRRAQIMAEIGRLGGSKPQKLARLSRIEVLIWAAGYATLLISLIAHVIRFNSLQ